MTACPCDGDQSPGGCCRHGRVADPQGEHPRPERDRAPHRQAADGGGQVPLRLPDGGGPGPQQQAA